jgi:hypothetical protein
MSVRLQHLELILVTFRSGAVRKKNVDSFQFVFMSDSFDHHVEEQREIFFHVSLQQ